MSRLTVLVPASVLVLEPVVEVTVVTRGSGKSGTIGTTVLEWLTVLVPASVLVLEPVVEVTVVAGVVVSPGVVELVWLTVLVPASVLVLEPVVEVRS